MFVCKKKKIKTWPKFWYIKLCMKNQPPPLSHARIQEMILFGGVGVRVLCLTCKWIEFNKGILPPFYKGLILSSCLILKFCFIVLDNYEGRDMAKQALSSDGAGLGL